MAAENNPPPDWVAFAVALLIALMSGFISIAQRIVRGTKASLLWIASEFSAAALVGVLAWDAYPVVHPLFPTWLEWMTWPIFVAVCAHFGGRTFQEIEKLLYQRGLRPGDSRRK